MPRDPLPTADLKDVIDRVRGDPARALRAVVALARGQLLKARCRLRGVRFEVGRNFRLFGSVRFSGPGHVVFGDNITVDRIVTPYTSSRDAVIIIGSNSYLNGVRLSCKSRIEIGAFAILGDASIADTDFHSVCVNRHHPDAPVKTASVKIGENVWIGSSAGILPGTEIGANSVVGYGAVCSGAYPGNSIIVGNPARVVKSIPSNGVDQHVRSENVLMVGAETTST